ncbi:mobile mystery protein A [Pelagibius marinus]|uniref:mobile mystery protein A n=1 Tax=Pelagibius marinus TaxID=2762760 RepID=UPI0018730CF5|nr:mobile mystery protein A [Pelagibius marinus]
MNVKDTARKQYVRIVDRAAAQLRNCHRPQDGWLALLRRALGMSGANVAARMGVSRNAVYQAERNEREGAITIAQMRKIAEAMGAEFVYAVIPKKGSVEDVIRTQAQRKAEARVRRASSHMALESQSLPSEQTRGRIEDLAEKLVRDMPPDFWEVK